MTLLEGEQEQSRDDWLEANCSAPYIHYAPYFLNAQLSNHGFLFIDDWLGCDQLMSGATAQAGSISENLSGSSGSAILAMVASDTSSVLWSGVTQEEQPRRSRG